MRAQLTVGLDGLRRPVLRAACVVLFLAASSCALLGCGPQAGGQSGTEGCLPASPKDDTRITFAEVDDDGGTDLDAGAADVDAGDAGTGAALIATEANPENADAPRQCVVPER